MHSLGQDKSLIAPPSEREAREVSVCSAHNVILTINQAASSVAPVAAHYRRPVRTVDSSMIRAISSAAAVVHPSPPSLNPQFQVPGSKFQVPNPQPLIPNPQPVIRPRIWPSASAP